jgi:hypothetical protein
LAKEERDVGLQTPLAASTALSERGAIRGRLTRVIVWVE